jgi:tRNA uridine 5-carboxymethylaminomethyl modification enzyme
MKMFKVAARPQLNFNDVRKFPGVEQFILNNNIDNEVIEQTEIHVKYSGYIEKEKNSADKLQRLENIKIPVNFNYQNVQSISFEAREKLIKIQPTTISQASRISGVSPSDVSVLLVYMGR